MSEALSEALSNTAAIASADIEAAKDAAIENAQAAVEAAEETAEQIAAAAMESERGRRLEEIGKDLAECRVNQSSQATILESLKLQITELAAKLESLLLLPLIVSAQSTPPASQPKPPTPAATGIVEEIAATASDQSANIESAVLPRKAGKRFL